MKRFIIMTLALMIILTGCSGKTDFSYSTEITESPTLTIVKNNESYFYYQGFVDLKVKGIKDLDIANSIEVSNISFEGNKPGTATLHKAGPTYFYPDDAKNIENELKLGRKYDILEFSGNKLVKEDGTGTIKLQYIILGAPSNIPKDEAKRTATMTVSIKNSNDRVIGSKEISFEIR